MMQATGPEGIPDSIAVALDVARRLERLDLRYVVGGSLASSIHGEPRSTLDVDIVIEVAVNDADALVTDLRDAYYVDQDVARTAVRDASTFNAVHIERLVKVDFFVAGHDAFEAERLARALLVRVGPGPADELRMDTPENSLLRKLEWYRRGGEVSERQWRDVEGIVALQHARLDREYLLRWAEVLGVSDLLARALAGGGPTPVRGPQGG